MHSADKRGYILADHAADLNREWVTQHYPQFSIMVASMREVYNAWIGDIPLCVTEGSSTALISLQHTFAAQNFAHYIQTRLKKTAYGTFY